jgi:hypothetical protein
MARRGSNSFRRNDAIRALRSAVDGGMEPAAFEVVIGMDGAVTYRVYSEKAAGLLPLAPETAAGAREWADEIEKLKKAKPKAKRPDPPR